MSKTQQIQVGPYKFVQAVQIEHKKDTRRFTAVPIEGMFAIPGGKIVPRKDIEAWAESNGFKVRDVEVV